MAKERTRLDEKNIFLGSSNQLVAAISQLMNQIRMLTDYEGTVPNIGTSYQNKVLELETIFKEHKLDFFGEEQQIIRNIMMSDMIVRLDYAMTILEQRMKWLERFSLLTQFRILSNKMMEWLLKDYLRMNQEVTSYSVEGDFVKALINHLYINDYDRMPPNSYQEAYKKGKEIIAAFGLENQIKDANQEILSLIESQEKASFNYSKSKTYIYQ